MIKVLWILIGLLCLVGTVGAQTSPNYDLHWNVIGGGGEAMSSSNYRIQGTIGQLAGFSQSSSFQLFGGYWFPLTSEVITPLPLPGIGIPPTDPDLDWKFEDLNGNGNMDFADVVLFFEQIEWVDINEPHSAFDFNNNGGIDFADIVKLFEEV